MVVGFVILFPTSIYGQVSVTDGGTYVENQFVGETEQEDKNPLNSLIDSIVNEGIAVSASIIGMGLSYLFFWLRKKGIEITPQQEKMFKELLTNRYKKLAKDSWKTFRADETKFTDALREGRIPNDLVTILTSNGKEFAEELLKKNEFKDFAKNLAEGTVDKLLEDIRTDLKNENQKRMLDILPKIAGIAVDSAFKENRSFKDWGEEALKNIKPLLVNAEALESESNLRLIIESEINKRIQVQINSQS